MYIFFTGFPLSSYSFIAPLARQIEFNWHIRICIRYDLRSQFLVSGLQAVTNSPSIQTSHFHLQSYCTKNRTATQVSRIVIINILIPPVPTTYQLLALSYLCTPYVQKDSAVKVKMQTITTPNTNPFTDNTPINACVGSVAITPYGNIQ